ncbi:hypothetical protein AYI68_g4664 [Smittium mucronatum]|uniref:Uncharacterized protein n=1 Tax=Smittium mucronatum TaxID=133383 RepID=A0A1R0GWF4_9FUNG|nr:hypothetical protein AYI68_g4664 [Smittium mucronatum]
MNEYISTLNRQNKLLNWEISESFSGGSISQINFIKEYNSSEFDIKPLSTFQSSLALWLDKREHVDSKITLSFPSPGSSKTLSQSHSFSIYLIYQFHRHFSSNLLSDLSRFSIIPEIKAFKMKMLKIRELFKINQSLGIVRNSVCFLNTSSTPDLYFPKGSIGIDGPFIFIISEISDFNYAICNWLFPSSTHSSDVPLSFISKLTEELTS